MPGLKRLAKRQNLINYYFRFIDENKYSKNEVSPSDLEDHEEQEERSNENKIL